jgi:putative transposase
MMGFKAFHSAKATIDGIETAHILRKGQLSENNMPDYKQFMALAG